MVQIRAEAVVLPRSHRPQTLDLQTSRRREEAELPGREARGPQVHLGIPARLTRIAEHIESKSRAKTFSFEVVFNREFAME